MIKNIIFDFGDIFINLDKKATHLALANLGIKEITKAMIDVYHKYEKGLISTSEFIDFYEKKEQVRKEDLITAWNAILQDFPQKRLHFITDLAQKKNFRLFLLSNTNELHISWIKRTIGEDFFATFKNSFEQFYLSHEIHLRKPDQEIYEFVLEQNNLVANETLFVDDLKENTDAASKLGIHVWNLNPLNDDVTELFTKNSIF